MVLVIVEVALSQPEVNQINVLWVVKTNEDVVHFDVVMYQIDPVQSLNPIEKLHHCGDNLTRHAFSLHLIRSAQIWSIITHEHFVVLWTLQIGQHLWKSFFMEPFGFDEL